MTPSVILAGLAVGWALQQAPAPVNVGSVMSFTVPVSQSGFLDRGHVSLGLGVMKPVMAPAAEDDKPSAPRLLTTDRAAKTVELAAFTAAERDEALEWDTFDPQSAALMTWPSETGDESALVYLQEDSCLLAGERWVQEFELPGVEQIWESWCDEDSIHVLLGDGRNLFDLRVERGRLASDEEPASGVSLTKLDAGDSRCLLGGRRVTGQPGQLGLLARQKAPAEPGSQALKLDFCVLPVDSAGCSGAATLPRKAWASLPHLSAAYFDAHFFRIAIDFAALDGEHALAMGFPSYRGFEGGIVLALPPEELGTPYRIEELFHGNVGALFSTPSKNHFGHALAFAQASGEDGLALFVSAPMWYDCPALYRFSVDTLAPDWVISPLTLGDGFGHPGLDICVVSGRDVSSDSRTNTGPRLQLSLNRKARGRPFQPGESAVISCDLATGRPDHGRGSVFGKKHLPADWKRR